MTATIVTRIEGQPENVWAVIVADDASVHVVPWDDQISGIHPAHTATTGCACRPTPKRNAPLDDAVWSHHEPTWPGNEDWLT